MPLKSSTFIQRMFARNITDSSQAMQVYVSEPVYFHMEIADAAKGSLTRTDEPTTLEPGRTYKVHVWVSPNQLAKEFPFVSCAGGELWLRFPEGLQIKNPRRQLPTDDEKEYDDEFEIQLADPSHCPAGEFTIDLLFRECKSKSTHVLATQLHIRLTGSYDPELMRICGIAPDSKPPANTAFLYVSALTSETLQLRYFCESGAPPDPLPIARPDIIQLAEFREESTDPEDVLNYMRSFTRSALGPITEQFDRLCRQESCVVIVDYTNSEVPWEMLELSDGTYLGAGAVVTRWLPKNWAGEELHVEDETISGSIMAFWQGEETEHIVKVRETLEPFVVQHYETREQWKHHLKDLAGVGIVYIDHCDLAPHAFESLTRNEDERPLLFVNDSHSGRLRCELRKTSGLPEVLLARVASGYIGTLGLIDSPCRTLVAIALFRAACSDPEGMRPADLLRQLRKQVAQQLAENQTKKDAWLSFIYVFMYVYYGNPFARLLLARSSPVGGDT